jgi:predicted secreted hydrolase
MTFKRAWRLASIVILIPLMTAAGWRMAQPGYPWSFPRDHWSHPEYRTEWWYFAGILEDLADASRHFGYQFTVFRVGLAPGSVSQDSGWSTRQLFMGHAAIGDFLLGTHRFTDLLYRDIPLLSGFGVYPDPRLAWSRAPAGTAGEWELTWKGEGFAFRMKDDERGIAFDLSTRSLKKLVLEGPDGFSRKGAEPGAASLYYSLTRLATSGTLRVGDRTLQVKGESWMDREFGSSQLQQDQVGWDWFGLRLKDGRDVMLYVLRNRQGKSDFRRGTVASSSAEAKYLSDTQWSLRATSTWKSPHTGTLYPSAWVLEIPVENLKLDILPILEDQEDVGWRSASLHYWEGAVRVMGSGGTQVGEGYVELTGYGKNNRPPL